MFNVAYLALGWKRNVGLCARNEKQNRTTYIRNDSTPQRVLKCRHFAVKNAVKTRTAVKWRHPLKTKPCDKIVEIFRVGLDSVRKGFVPIEAFTGT